VSIPQTLGVVFPQSFLHNLSVQLGQGMPLYNLLYVVGIIFFAFFYVSIIFNPMEVADNIRKYGGYIPGIRPGKRTAEYIDRILSRLTAAGAIYLVIVCLLPEFLITGFKVQPLPWIGPKLDDWLTGAGLSVITTGLGVTFYFGGTSLLIVVGVAMDTVQQIESQLIMRHYDGFMKKGRIRGRRG
jgi:preprotein translocase subunit SecY